MLRADGRLGIGVVSGGLVDTPLTTLALWRCCRWGVLERLCIEANVLRGPT